MSPRGHIHLQQVLTQLSLGNQQREVTETEAKAKPFILALLSNDKDQDLECYLLVFWHITFSLFSSPFITLDLHS